MGQGSRGGKHREREESGWMLDFLLKVAGGIIY